LRAAARLLLGLFVLGQVVFLLVSNLPGGEDALRRAARGSAWLREELSAWVAGEDGATQRLEPGIRAARRWSEWTGQHQPWQLFAPDLAEVVPFLVVVLSWDDHQHEPVTLLSENEPADRHRFFRLGRFRLRRAETALDIAPSSPADDFDPTTAAWRDTLWARVRADQVGFATYLRWRVARYRLLREEVPPPDEVRLLVRLYRIPPPPGPRPWDWQDLGEHPVLRWRASPAGQLHLFNMEVFDPVAGRFKKQGEP
jgi:hypothetical protein